MKNLFIYLVCLLALSCKGNGQTSATITLRVGEAINFASGKVTRSQQEGDLVFKYLPPQSPHGWRYNALNGQFEYQAKVATKENYPLLEASKTASFKTKPMAFAFTVGDINQWTEDEYDVGPGRFIIARGLTDNRHYLLKINSIKAPTKDPSSWSISFSYEPFNAQLGAPGTAGKNFAVKGKLIYRERIVTNSIISLDLSNGKTNILFDGYSVSRNDKGEYAYVDKASRIIIADRNGKQLAIVPTPPIAQKAYSANGPDEVVLSPSGNFIAVQGQRSKTYKTGGFEVGGISLTSLVVIDRQGREVGAFIEAQQTGWTKDDRLVFSRPAKPGLFISDKGFKTVQEIPSLPSANAFGMVAVHPNGKMIAFSAGGRIWTVGMNGSNLKQISPAGLDAVTPVWSPDGNHLAFQQSLAEDRDLYQIVICHLSDNKFLYVRDELGNRREPTGRMNWSE